MKNAIWNLPNFTLNLEGLWKHLDPVLETAAVAEQLNASHQAVHEKFTSKEIGFYDWPAEGGPNEAKKAKELAESLRKDYDGALLFGIGGSYLGPAALLQALQSPEMEEAFPHLWLSNIDPPAIERAKHFCKGKKVAAVIISKSGGTVETLSSFYHMSPLLDEKGIVAITGPGKGELRRLADKHGWRTMDVPPNIGGRFSVLSAVGLLPAALGGLNTEEIISGASTMRKHLEEASPLSNPAYLFAFSQYYLDQEKQFGLQYLMPYWSSLASVSDWYVQLWAESLGKKTLAPPNRSVGPTPAPALGSSDQHSLLQLFKEGPNNKVVGFIDVEQPSGLTVGQSPYGGPDYEYLFAQPIERLNHLACLSTQTSLGRSNVPTYRIEIPKLDGPCLGALYFFFETACAFAGELYGVNAFNQPGVEEAKQLLRDALCKK